MTSDQRFHDLITQYLSILCLSSIRTVLTPFKVQVFRMRSCDYGQDGWSMKEPSLIPGVVDWSVRLTVD